MALPKSCSDVANCGDSFYLPVSVVSVAHGDAGSASSLASGGMLGSTKPCPGSYVVCLVVCFPLMSGGGGPVRPRERDVEVPVCSLQVAARAGWMTLHNVAFFVRLACLEPLLKLACSLTSL